MTDLKQLIRDKKDKIFNLKEEIKTFLYDEKRTLSALQDKNANFIVFYLSNFLFKRDQIIANIEHDFEGICAIVSKIDECDKAKLIEIQSLLDIEFALLQEEFESIKISKK
jgi:hypothetical protein